MPGILSVKRLSSFCAMFLCAGGVSLLRPWEVLAPLQAAACWLFTIGDVLLGVRPAPAPSPLAVAVPPP